MPAPDWLTAQPIAHRGFHDMNSTVYENTLAAFARAMEAGFAIECDLQFAADGVPVVFHDSKLDRLCGLPGRTRDRTSGELKQLAVGGTRERIPTFSDMLRHVAGRVPLVVELKEEPGDDDGFAGAVLDALEDYDGPVALMSFGHALLQDLKGLDCPFPLGLTAEGVRPAHFAQHQEAMDLGLDFVSYNVHHLPNDFVSGLRERKVPVITWTVRDTAARKATEFYGDQMTFEGFDPREV
jgi:glycerophosphoryl diester phosphodiesterase